MARHNPQKRQNCCDNHPLQKCGSQKEQFPMFHDNYPNCAPQKAMQGAAGLAFPNPHDFCCVSDRQGQGRGGGGRSMVLGECRGRSMSRGSALVCGSHPTVPLGGGGAPGPDLHPPSPQTAWRMAQVWGLPKHFGAKGTGKLAFICTRYQMFFSVSPTRAVLKVLSLLRGFHSCTTSLSITLFTNMASSSASSSTTTSSSSAHTWHSAPDNFLRSP